MIQAYDKQRWAYNAHHAPVDFNVGDLVMVHAHHLSSAVKQFAASLAPEWTEPYQIIQTLSQTTFDLETEYRDYVGHHQHKPNEALLSTELPSVGL